MTRRRFRHQNLRLSRPYRRRFPQRSRWTAKRKYGRARNHHRRPRHHLRWCQQSLARWSRNAKTHHRRRRVWTPAKAVLATVAPATSASTIWAPLSLTRSFTARVTPARRVTIITITTITIMPAIIRHPRQLAGPRRRCCKILWIFVITSATRSFLYRSFFFRDRKKIIYILWNIYRGKLILLKNTNNFSRQN